MCVFSYIPLYVTPPIVTHDLKLWPEYFEPVARYEKTFEIRYNDRDYKVDDWLRLREYCPHLARYTGREVMSRISYITQWEQKPDFVVMAITKPVPVASDRDYTDIECVTMPDIYQLN